MVTDSLGKIANITNGILNNELFFSKRFIGISIDSRTIIPKQLFIAINGENFDGHMYIQQAAQRGASAVICNRNNKISSNIPCIYVQNTIQALHKIAHYARMQYNIPVIAITGSNGKTSTKELVAIILKEQFNVLKNEGNFNNEFGLPLTLFNLRKEHDCAIIEMGMRGLGQIKQLCNISKPNIGVITNVGEAHLSKLRTIQNIIKAKTELPKALCKNDLIVLNIDDANVKNMTYNTKAKVITYGLSKYADIRARNIYMTKLGIKFDVLYNKEDVFPIRINIIGKHNVYNALAAIAVCLSLKMDIELIKLGLSKYKAENMRMEIQNINGIVVLKDYYNSNPLSIEAAFDTLKLFEGRKIAVLGDMLDLGEKAIDIHFKIGVKIAVFGIDTLITYGILSKNMINGAKTKGIKKAMGFNSYDEIKSFLKGYLRMGDILLIKGSRGMHMENILSIFNKKN